VDGAMLSVNLQEVKELDLTPQPLIDLIELFEFLLDKLKKTMLLKKKQNP
jgi:hypothetical protein